MFALWFTEATAIWHECSAIEVNKIVNRNFTEIMTEMARKIRHNLNIHRAEIYTNAQLQFPLKDWRLAISRTAQMHRCIYAMARVWFATRRRETNQMAASKTRALLNTQSTSFARAQWMASRLIYGANLTKCGILIA